MATPVATKRTFILFNNNKKHTFLVSFFLKVLLLLQQCDLLEWVHVQALVEAWCVTERRSEQRLEYETKVQHVIAKQFKNDLNNFNSSINTSPT